MAYVLFFFPHYKVESYQRKWGLCCIHNKVPDENDFCYFISLLFFYQNISFLLSVNFTIKHVNTFAYL